MTLQDLKELQDKKMEAVEQKVCHTCFHILNDYAFSYANKDIAYVESVMKKLDFAMLYNPYYAYTIFYQFYAYLKRRHQEKDFNTLLEDYHFSYSYSIKEALYYLLGNKKDDIHYIDPLLFHGIQSINKAGFTYQIETNIGSICVNQASEVFKRHPSAHLFRKKLGGKCYKRSYEFLCENPSYTAVIQYVSQMFLEDGYYHVYLKKDNHVLDIAANAYYDSLEEACKLLTGEIIKEVSLDTIERDFITLRNEIKRVSKNQDKLQILTLYYDAKRCKE